MKRFMVIFGMVVAFVGVMAVSQAGATATLELISGGDTVVVADGSSLDTNPVTGAVTYIGTVGGYTINVTTGVTKPALGSAGDPKLDLSSLNISGSGAPLEVLFSEQGFTYSGRLVFAPSVTLLSSSPTTMVATAYWGSTTLTTSNLIGSPLTYSGSGGFATTSGIVTASSYALTEDLTVAPVTRGGPILVSADATLSATPEPASLFLVCGTLAGWGVSRRLKKKA